MDKAEWLRPLTAVCDTRNANRQLACEITPLPTTQPSIRQLSSSKHLLSERDSKLVPKSVSNRQSGECIYVQRPGLHTHGLTVVCSMTPRKALKLEQLTLSSPCLPLYNQSRLPFVGARALFGRLPPCNVSRHPEAPRE